MNCMSAVGGCLLFVVFFACIQLMILLFVIVRRWFVVRCALLVVGWCLVCGVGCLLVFEVWSLFCVLCCV